MPDPGPSSPPGIPLAYLISFRCYGTWLHGDQRGSMDRSHNVPGTEPLATNPWRELVETERLRQQPAFLSDAERDTVTSSIRRTCDHAGWRVLALNVRTEHVHTVLVCGARPEAAMGSVKSWATKALVAAGQRQRGQRVWSRHGSTRYLWTEESVELACRYVTDGQ